MTTYGYARVSTSDQDLTIQQEALAAACCEIVRSEKVSGTSVQGRDELQTLLEFVREGDELVVTSVDRLARSVLDLQTIVRDLKLIRFPNHFVPTNINTPQPRNSFVKA